MSLLVGWRMVGRFELVQRSSNLSKFNSIAHADKQHAKHSIYYNKQTGFTLVEIMVAMFVFVILSSIVVATLSGTFNAKKINDEQLVPIR